MTKKNWLLIFVALTLAGVYVFYFTDWFKPKTIHITSTNARSIRPSRATANADLTTFPIIFKLGRPCKLTELKVVALDEWQTNNKCLPLWHLMADTNSAKIERPFFYGDYIPGTRREDYIHGMKPVVPGMHAQPLQPGVKYRLFVTDGSVKGQHDFQPLAR